MAKFNKRFGYSAGSRPRIDSLLVPTRIPGIGSTASQKVSPAIILNGSIIFEDASAGTTVGTLGVVAVSGTPTFTLDNNDGGRIALTGGNVLQVGATALDYETHPVITIIVSVTGVTPSIPPRTIAINLTNVVVTLSALTLSSSSIAENSAPGTIVGAIQNKTAGSTLSITNDAGGRFALSGSNIVAGLTPTDFESATSHSITVRESHPEATVPRDTILTIAVSNVSESVSGARLLKTDGSLVLTTNGVDHISLTSGSVTHLASLLLTDGVSYLLTID